MKPLDPHHVRDCGWATCPSGSRSCVRAWKPAVGRDGSWTWGPWGRVTGWVWSSIKSFGKSWRMLHAGVSRNELCGRTVTLVPGSGLSCAVSLSTHHGPVRQRWSSLRFMDEEIEAPGSEGTSFGSKWVAKS